MDFIQMKHLPDYKWQWHLDHIFFGILKVIGVETVINKYYEMRLQTVNLKKLVCFFWLLQNGIVTWTTPNPSYA